MSDHVDTDNSRAFRTIAALAIAGGVVFTPARLPIGDSSGTGSIFAVQNESVSAQKILTPYEAELESPDFVPRQLIDFKARVFARRNRWS
jgi:hypothetical protein